MIINEDNKIKELRDESKNGKGINLYSAIWLLAKEQNVFGKDKIQMVEEIESWLKQSKIDNYDEIIHADVVTSICHKVIKYNSKPVNIESIFMSNKELETIKALNSKPLEKLAFGYLFNAKVNDCKNKNNNHKVDKPVGKIFREVGIKSYTSDKQEQMVYQLIQNNILRLCNIAFKNLSNEVLIIDDDIENNYCLKIDFFDNYIYEYENWCGNSLYKRCESCGIIIKKTNNRVKYCRNCKEKKQLEWDRNYQRTKKI